MERISWLWNLVFYNVYRWEKLTQRFFSYLVIFFLKNKKVKNAYEKRGVKNPDILINNILNNQETGLNNVFASIHMGGLLVLLEYGIFNFIQVMAGKSIIQDVWSNNNNILPFLVILLVPSGLFNYFILFKKDKYLKYFKEFNKMPKDKKLEYSWKSLYIILLFWMFSIVSFVAVIYFL